MIGIYIYRNKINQKVYIGQSTNIERRIKEHNSRAFQVNSGDYNSNLSRAIRKYGLDNFEINTITSCSKEELDNLEIYYINYYQSYLKEKGYNTNVGDEGGFAPKGVDYSWWPNAIENIFTMVTIKLLR